ncbi:hypothetical protein CR513_23959, partial [Mucuna pruriens]
MLKTFQRVEINILLLDAIKQIPNYAKFLKELCMHKRKKLKEGVEMGGVVSALIKNEEVTSLAIEMSRPQNFLYSMHHWRLYLCRCHAGLSIVNPRSFFSRTQCVLNVFRCGVNRSKI